MPIRDSWRIFRGMISTRSRDGFAEGMGDLGLDVAPLVVKSASSPSSAGVATNFSGHETFAFRYTWLKKGVDAFTADADVFRSERAIVTLGVGKNMVSSIRYWAGATGVFDGAGAVPGSRVKALGVSRSERL